jgi:hypothetical protein
MFTLGIVDTTNSKELYNGLIDYLISEQNPYSIEVKNIEHIQDNVCISYNTLVHNIFFKDISIIELFENRQNMENFVHYIKQINVNQLVFILDNKCAVFNGIWGQMDLLYQLFSGLPIPLSFFVYTNFEDTQNIFLTKHNINKLSYNQMIHSYVYAPSSIFYKELNGQHELKYFFDNINRYLQIENRNAKYKIFGKGEAFTFVAKKSNNLDIFLYHCNKFLYP